MSSLLIAVLVAARIAATSWANVVQKRLLNPAKYSPLGLFTVVWSWMALLMAPWWLMSYGLGGQFWWWMLLTCLLEVPGNVLLLRSLRATELSIFGPLSSSKPAISLMLAFVIFGETTTWAGMLGVAVVLIGSLLLTSPPLGSSAEPINSAQRAERRRGIRDRLLAVLLTALASVFLKQSLSHATSWQALSAWCVLSWLLATAWSLMGRSWQPREKRATLTTFLRQPPHQAQAILLVALSMLIMQGCTIALFARMPVGYALALFQIGSLVSVVLGHRLFGEGQLVRRLVAATIMVLGAVIIILAG